MFSLELKMRQKSVGGVAFGAPVHIMITHLKIVKPCKFLDQTPPNHQRSEQVMTQWCEKDLKMKDEKDERHFKTIFKIFC